VNSVVLLGVHITNHTVCWTAGYSVDVRDEDVNLWQNLTSFVGGLSYVAKELRKGTRYRFRVRAENKFGASQAAETDLILAKDPYGIYTVWR